MFMLIKPSHADSTARSGKFIHLALSLLCICLIGFAEEEQFDPADYTHGTVVGEAARALMPSDEPCPLPQSDIWSGVSYTGRWKGYERYHADTWYPSWGADGRLYTPYTDGRDLENRKATSSNSQWVKARQNFFSRYLGWTVDKETEKLIKVTEPRSTRTGNAIMTGDDPFDLKVEFLKVTYANTIKFEGYYPCANLYQNGVWYYGRYYCHRWLNDDDIPIVYELGTFGGFRISEDQGESWTESPITQDNLLFPERGRCMGEEPIKMGAPHVVDFGQELENSPDGKMYLVGHGTTDLNGIANWCSGDAAFLARVYPSPETVNDPDAYEFYAGRDADGKPLWVSDFSKIKPIIEWDGHTGCVNMTYHPYFKRYFAFITAGWADGGPGCYNTWIVESESLTGPWENVAYLKGSLGGQPYFVNMPSKFIKPDSNKLVVFYSANWRPDREGIESWIDESGPGGRYELCVAEFELLKKTAAER